MPKIPILDWTEALAEPHPLLDVTYDAYAHKAIGDAAGLTQFGAHLERLPSGARSSLRHWHEAEDELVYVVSGEVTLIEDTETTLAAGEAAAWKAGSPVGHCLENRRGADAVLLVVGTRAARDVVHYPDHDLVLSRDGARRRYARADGTLIKET